MLGRRTVIAQLLTEFAHCGLGVRLLAVDVTRAGDVPKTGRRVLAQRAALKEHALRRLDDDAD